MFSEKNNKKTIVAGTNSTVFIYLSTRILKKAHKVSCQEASAQISHNYLHARQIPHPLSFSSQTLTD